MVLLIRVVFLAAAGLSSQYVVALEITRSQLPLEYRCRQTVIGGVVLDRSNRKWTSVSPKNESMSFVLQIYSFSPKVMHPKCDVAITASGKKDDSYSKSRRDLQQDVCVIMEIDQREKYGLTGPIIRYCSVGGPGSSRLVCQEPPTAFSFDSRSLTYMENEMIGIAFDGRGQFVYAGTCSRN